MDRAAVDGALSVSDDDGESLEVGGEATVAAEVEDRPVAVVNGGVDIGACSEVGSVGEGDGSVADDF